MRSPIDLRASRAAQVLTVGIAVVTGMLIPLGIAWRTGVDHLIWSGSISGLAEDTMQYLAWIRESSEHFAAGNLLSPAKPIRDFVHPGVLSSALLHRLGLSIPLSYAIWVPVATATICAGAWMFMRDVLPRGWPRATGLALGLLYSAPTFLSSSPGSRLRQAD